MCKHCIAGTVSYTHLDVYKRQVNVHEKQLEKPTQTENGNIQEMLRIMMEKMDENSKKLDSTKGELSNQIGDTNLSLIHI